MKTLERLLKDPRLGIVLAVLVAFGIGMQVGRKTSQITPMPSRSNGLREGGYKYISPLLLCSTENRDVNEDTVMTSEITDYINHAPEKDVSVYFFRIKDRRWSGVNEDETFSPASMLKVPTVAAVLKYAESHNDFLSTEILYDGSFDDNGAEYFKPQKSIQPGHKYTVEELLEYTIVDSDNNAVKLLHNVIDSREFTNIYISLGMQIPQDPSDFMSPKNYSLFLRLLYNSTYLTRPMSEKILRLMVESHFTQGLTSGIPSTIETAHKFGEWRVINSEGVSQESELHDCGIVYQPNNPYVLCVMTRGDHFEGLAPEIRDISKIVHDRVMSYQ